MVSIGILVFLIPGILVITAATLIIYKIFYDKHNNRVLESGETNRRKWIAPWGLALIVLGAQLILSVGLMFIFSLFMINPDSLSVEEEEASRIYYEYSDIKEFTVGDEHFKHIGTGSRDGITIKMYQRNNEDGTVDFIFTGSVEGIEDDNIYFDFSMIDDNDTKYGLSTVWPMNAGSTTLYYMIRIRVDEYVPAKVTIGVGFGTDFDYQRDGWDREFLIRYD